MNFTDVFQEIFLKNNGNKYNEYNMYLVTAIDHADDEYKEINNEEIIDKNRKNELWLNSFIKFLKDNNVSEDAINSAKTAVLDAVDYLRVIEVS
ncbi:hypothetical protein [Mycoplasma sp. P36-A1]|uniref:hypothetical protein n=1 Tax=Mycoplasma sp. P36-A1 TaxID=3252900 RepID=UPI003C2F7A43